MPPIFTHISFTFMFNFTSILPMQCMSYVALDGYAKCYSLYYEWSKTNKVNNKLSKCHLMWWKIHKPLLNTGYNLYYIHRDVCSLGIYFKKKKKSLLFVSRNLVVFQFPRGKFILHFAKFKSQCSRNKKASEHCDSRMRLFPLLTMTYFVKFFKYWINMIV